MENFQSILSKFASQEAQRLSKMAGRSVDFVVCYNDFSIVSAIELVWPNDTGNGISAEDEKRQAPQSLGIPLIVVRPNANKNFQFDTKVGRQPKS